MLDLSLIKELIERDIITKNDKDLFSEILRNERNLTNFFKNHFGWTLYKDRYVIRLVKTPSNPEGYMGNGNFITKEDYCIYMAFLIALESYSKGEKFRFMDIFEILKLTLEKIIDISWEKSSNRKAVKRVFEYAEKKRLIINEAKEIINTEENDLKEIKVYYSKTDYCSPKYILNTQNNIFSFESYEDFKTKDLMESELHAKRTLFIKLISKPVVYFSELTVQERDILKNKRVFEKLLEEIEGEIHYHKDCIFLFFKDTQIGEVYPNAINSENTMVLMINSILREKVREGKLILNDEDDTFILKKEELSSLIEEYRVQNMDWLPQVIKKPDISTLADKIVEKLKEWLFLKEERGNLVFYPAIGKINGKLCEDVKVEEEEQRLF
ncbi:DUF2398 family protein [uncultured Fusobacterium sp.]|uniref:DUF2398 family protein n=1 Tax=uncultured Fusobacterium sp. TaxID=159267 RepID=UPI002600A22D|nr:DUF2398 family protein [uncultured Fusobacterium sp.]